jgi:hypothetical protein
MEQGAASRQQSPGPPEWALEPIAAWIYLAVNIGLFSTRLFIPLLALAIVAAVVTYQERRAQGLPAAWWTIGVAVLGPLAYLFFVYKRSKNAVVYSPEQALAQHSRLSKGLPPQPLSPPPGPAPADWYPDPTGEARLRYWDGTAWTDHTAA